MFALWLYTVEIPEIAVDNHIAFKQPVNPEIIRRAENKLGKQIPEKFVLDGKDFRKYLAKHFENRICIDLTEGASLEKALQLAGEKEASAFLSSTGVDFIVWPYSWKNPSLGTNVAVLDENNIKIVKIEQVVLDSKKQLIPGSEKEVKL